MLLQELIDSLSHLCSYRRIVLIFVLFVMILISILILKEKSSFQSLPLNVILSKDDQLISPFSHTLGFIRWNSPHYQRISLMEFYRPFFNQLHYSIPGYSTQLNYTQDGFISIEYPYKVVSETMTILLQNHPTIQGLLYFHFDAWINPLKFDDMNLNKIWFLDGTLPPFRCVTNTGGWDWWAWTQGLHFIAKNATQNVAKKYPNRYQTDKDIFCGGWSDIYYIPRRFFQDFIDLSNIFYAAHSFHEVAIPTMINIIDQTYRLTPFQSVIQRIKDCWGNCCSSGSTPADIKDKRCGHRMDLTNELIRKTLIELLNTQSTYLNITSRNQTKN